VKLDARPFEAQLRAARAQRAKDAALLENAKTDLRRYEFLVQNDSAEAHGGSIEVAGGAATRFDIGARKS
jgi:multidrug resistance efflux pump